LDVFFLWYWWIFYNWFFKYDDLFEFLNDFSIYDGYKVQWRLYDDNVHLFFSTHEVYNKRPYFVNSKKKRVKYYLKDKKSTKIYLFI